jgi:predicted transcriptional regulator of viral defense system
MIDAKQLLLAASEESGGVLSAKQICEAGYNRPALAQMVKNGELVRVRHGFYSLPDQLQDEYALLQSRSSQAVYSYGTALFFWGLSDRVPHILDLTVSQGTNTTKIRRDNPDVRFHYVSSSLLELGKTETPSPQGGIVTLYDKERCICDIVRARNKTDMQLYTQAIKHYFAQKPNTRKLLKYAKQLGVEDKIRSYVEVLA